MSFFIKEEIKLDFFISFCYIKSAFIDISRI